jgi:hypothetical protein
MRLGWSDSERARETTQRGTESSNEAGVLSELLAWNCGWGLGRKVERSYVLRTLQVSPAVTGTLTVLRWEISKRRASTLERDRAAENPFEARGDYIIGRSLLPSRRQKFPCPFRSAVLTRKHFVRMLM